jgi:hypothetical protein
MTSTLAQTPTAAKDRALGLDAKGRVTMLPSAWIDG